MKTKRSVVITSVKNPLVSRMKMLIKSAEERKKEKLFVAEGKRLVCDIIKSGYVPDQLYVSEKFLKKESLDNIEEVEATRVTLVSENVLQAMSDTKTPQGVVACFRIPNYAPKDLFNENPFLLILEEIRDPGNLGTMFRTFEAAGGTGIITVGPTVDIYSPKCVRSTMGSIVRMPVVHCETVNDLKDILKDTKINIFATAMNGDDYTKKDYCEPVGIIIGNEARGLSKEAMGIATDTVTIPMEGKVESLNAAISVAILAFEAKRQRKGN